MLFSKKYFTMRMNELVQNKQDNNLQEQESVTIIFQ